MNVDGASPPSDGSAQLRRQRAVRYVTPLREGGSLPGLVEADDLGTYVMKFRGAGQGVKVLVAETIVGELARAVDLPSPALLALELPAALARYEPDEEVQDLLAGSLGLNLGMDFLPGAQGYDGSVAPSPEQAARLVWLDAFTANVDRTWANPNLLVWHGQPWLIDHGAALYFHHAWPSTAADVAPDPGRFARQSFDASSHVAAGVLPLEPGLMLRVHRELAPVVPSAIERAVAAVPSEWLETTGGLPTQEHVRQAYRDFLSARLAAADRWLPSEETLAQARAGLSQGQEEARAAIAHDRRQAILRPGEEPR